MNERGQTFWITNQGWLALDGSSSGSWFQAPPLEAARQIIPKEGPCHLLLAPDFYLFFRLDSSSLGPQDSFMTFAEEHFGLELGHWRFQTAGFDNQLLVAAVPNQIVPLMERLQGHDPERVVLSLFPAHNQSGQECSFLFHHNTHMLETAWDEQGLLKSWHLLFHQDEPLADLPFPEFLNLHLGQAQWLDWEGDIRAKFRLLRKIVQVLSLATAACAFLAMLAWGFWLIKRPKLNHSRLLLQDYIALHRKSAQEIAAIQQAAVLNWDQLMAIRKFGNRQLPFANVITQLANTSPDALKWSEFKWVENTFEIKAEVQHIDIALEYFEKLKQLGICEDVRFQKMQADNKPQPGSRNPQKKFNILITGRVP